jgi:hypothetical protein
MQKTITIPIKEYKCLREHLDQAFKIFERLGSEHRGEASERISSSSKPKETKRQAMDRIKKAIASGERAKKPSHLKK